MAFGLSENRSAFKSVTGRPFQRIVPAWAYCLMPNHVHLIAVPKSQDGLRRAIGEAHRRYTRRVNFRERWRGHLWQGRFASFVMEEKAGRVRYS
jgi:REP element-mobilizing transposase RayT